MSNRLLILTLTACMALSGCGRPTPPEAARVGGHQSAYRQAPSAGGSLVGRWHHPLGRSVYYQFNTDGTFKHIAAIGSEEGNWRLLPGGQIELNTPGIFSGRSVRRFNYRLHDNKLDLDETIYWLTYTKIP